MKKIMACLIWMIFFHGYLFAQEDTHLIEQYRHALKQPVYTKGVGDSSIPAAGEPSLVLNLKFKINSHEITPESIRSLNALGIALSEDNELWGYKYRIEGHTCSLGSAEYNRLLSEKRADAVRTYLTKNYHLSEKQFEIIGYGEDKPVAPNNTEDERSRNRRVIIVNTLKKVEVAGKLPFNLDVKVKYLKDKGEAELKDNDTLTQKDGYAVEFSPKGKVFVYVYQVSEKVEQLFPNKKFSGEANPVESGRFYRVPTIGRWFYLDEKKGKEYFIVIANRSELKNPEQFIGRLPGQQYNAKGIQGTIEIPPQGEPTVSSQPEDVTSGIFLWKISFDHR